MRPDNKFKFETEAYTFSLKVAQVNHTPTLSTCLGRFSIAADTLEGSNLVTADLQKNWMNTVSKKQPQIQQLKN